MKKTVIFLCVVLLTVSSLVLAAEEEAKKDWELSTKMSIWSRYLTTGGFVGSKNPSLQPEFTLSHKSGWYGCGWASIDMKRGDWTEVDYYLGYQFEIVPTITIDAGLAYYQLRTDPDEIAPYVMVSKGFQFQGDASVFVKQEVPIEYETGRDSYLTYVGLKHEWPIPKVKSLSLIQIPQVVVGNGFDGKWSSVFAYDAMLTYKITENLSAGPAIKVRVPMSLPSDDCRKTEVAVGGFVNYKF